MPTQPNPSNPAPAASSPGQQATDAQYYRHVLHELIDMGTTLARAVHGQAMAQAQAAGNTAGDAAAITPAPDLATPFDRIARCVRRTVLLARHVSEPSPAGTAGPGRVAARKQILRHCEDRIAVAAFNRRRHGGLDTDALHAELLERLDSPELADDLDDDIANHPVPVIVAAIAADLGLGLDDMPGTCPALRRTPADIAALHARAAAPPGTMPPGPTPSLAPPRPTPPGTPGAAPPPGDHDGMDDMLALCARLIRDG